MIQTQIKTVLSAVFTSEEELKNKKNNVDSLPPNLRVVLNCVNPRVPTTVLPCLKYTERTRHCEGTGTDSLFHS